MLTTKITIFSITNFFNNLNEKTKLKIIQTIQNTLNMYVGVKGEGEGAKGTIAPYHHGLGPALCPFQRFFFTRKPAILIINDSFGQAIEWGPTQR